MTAVEKFHEELEKLSGMKIYHKRIEVPASTAKYHFEFVTKEGHFVHLSHCSRDAKEYAQGVHDGREAIINLIREWKKHLDKLDSDGTIEE